MKPGEVTTVPMKEGGKGVFEPGTWVVHYAPTSRELTVQVSLESFRIEIGDGVLEGKGTDLFVGTVSEDGQSWEADWTSFPQYTARTPENPSVDLTVDPEEGVTETLVFEKVAEEQ